MRGDEILRDCEATLERVALALFRADVKLRLFEFENFRSTQMPAEDLEQRAYLRSMPDSLPEFYVVRHPLFSTIMVSLL